MLTDALRIFKSKLQSSLSSSDRRAKIQDADFIIGLVYAVASSKSNFTLADLRLAACNYLGTTIGRSAFNERLATAALVKNLRLALASLIGISVANSSPAATSLAAKLGVASIVGIDASMVTLWDGLSDLFKGTFMAAATKLHLAVDLVTGSVRWFALTAGATHDSQRFPVLLSDQLHIFDLGYWSFELLQQISQRSGFFLCRVKSNADLTVSRVIHGMGKRMIGSNLLSYPILRRRSTIVELVAFTYTGGTKRAFRVIGLWDKKTKGYHWYLTNLKAPRKLIYDLYRLRWQIELSFKAMKSTLNFDRMPTLSPNAVESFTLVSLINYVFSVMLRAEAEIQASKSQNPEAKSSSIQKAAKAFSVGSGTILEALKNGRRLTRNWLRNLIETIKPLLRSVFDPNHNRRRNTVNRLLEA